MNVVQGWADLSRGVGVVLSMGVFDGVHLGHRALIREAVRRAQRIGARAVVLTFHPHPRSILAPESLWGYLCSLEERIARIAALDVDLMIILSFTPELAATTAEAFMRRLWDHVPLRELCVGQDFVLGRGGRGDVDLLRSLGERWGFAVRAIPPVCLDGREVSSTRIREFVQAGRVIEAGRWLGRPFSLQGQVIRGAGQGRRLGFPTANLRLHPRLILPGDGVYAVRVDLPAALGGLAPQPGMAYVGRRPTFGPGERQVEVYLFDFAGDLLGCVLRVDFVRHLRPDRAFDSGEALAAQIRQDAERARAALAQAGL